MSFDLHHLATALTGRVCILGVGQRMRGDDGAGSWLAERLVGRISAPVFDGGSAPENYLEKVAALKPDTVLIVDAVDFGGAPGECRLFRAEKVGPGRLSTHAPSLALVAEYLRSRGTMGVALLAIQPSSTNLGQPLSDTVRRVVDDIASRLQQMFSSA